MVNDAHADSLAMDSRGVIASRNQPVILIVDDLPLNVDYLEQELEDLGYETVSAANGLEALEQVARTSPDMILLDIMMPEMDGFEVLERLKADKKWRDIPVVVISALTDMGSVVKGIELGADDYLPKPFDPILLKARLSAGLERKRLRDQEVEYLDQVERLTAAAYAVEQNTFELENLAFVAARQDALGRLARVFQRMAEEVHIREQRLKRQVEQLRLDREEWGAAEREIIAAYIPMDRRIALTRGDALPTRMQGAAIFADLSGFTTLAVTLAQTLGRKRGAEELVRQLNRVFEALITEVHNFRGSVVNFAGDGIICWFDDREATPSSRRSVACALAMQTRIGQLSLETFNVDLPLSLSIKTVVATGSVRRFLVGNPETQQLEVIAGQAVDEISAGGQLVKSGELLVTTKIAAEINDGLLAIEQVESNPKENVDDLVAERFVVVSGIKEDVPQSPWPEPQPHISVAQARPWLLAPIFEKIRSEKGHFLSELREATSLFLQFWGIDFVSDQRAEKKLDEFIRWVQSVITENSGIILHITVDDKGSYLYAVFGAPVAHEDDASCAVHAAQALQTPPSALSFISKVQIGLARGEMRTGSYGNVARRMYGVQGDKANLAARLMQVAKDGILCDEAVYQAARVRHEFEAVQPVILKGFEKTVPVYTPSGARSRLSYHRQIDQLSSSQQFTLKVASVLGVVFNMRALKAVYPEEIDSAELRENLNDLVDQELVAHQSSDMYRFRDPVIRNVVYESMLFGQRRKLHRAAARWYEKVYKDDLPQYYSPLIYHWKGAEDIANTIHYLELAGVQARKAGNFQEALKFYDEAIALESQAAMLSADYYQGMA